MLLGRHALELNFRRQRRNRRRHAILDQDLVLVWIRADREGDDQAVGAVARARRLHVDHVLDAVDVLLDRQSDGADESHGACAGITRRHLDGRRDDVRILGARQVQKRDEANEYEDERKHIGEHRSVDEKARDRFPLGLQSSFLIRGGRGGFLRARRRLRLGRGELAALRIDLSARKGALNAFGHHPVAWAQA